jgi:hypothetical protein
MITPCKPGPEERHEGRLLYTWRLAPGVAYLIDDDRREHVEVPVTPADLRAARYTYDLRFIGSHTVATFEVAPGRLLAQPLPEGPRAESSRRERRPQASKLVPSTRPAPAPKRKRVPFDPL